LNKTQFQLISTVWNAEYPSGKSKRKQPAMPFEYKCQSCQAIGDLDSFVNQIECPNCGGVMFPLTALSPAPAPAPAAPEEFNAGETPTTIVPRAELLKEMAAASEEQPKRVVKVAKIVNIGFGGMLTTSATRGFKPITPVKKNGVFSFTKQPLSPQQAQAQTTPSESAAEPDQKHAPSSSSTNLGGGKKTFTVSKLKLPPKKMQQTSTQYMDATQLDPRIVDRPQASLKNTQIQAQPENPQAPQEIPARPRLSVPTSASLKFLPKGALKVAQTHTAIQHSQLPPPPSKLQTQTHISIQAQQPPHFSEQDEDFAAQVRIEAERQEAIIREAYRIAEEKIRKEREDMEKKAAEARETPQLGTYAEKTGIAAQLSKELAETEELIRKERATLELRKKELMEIRKKVEAETAKAKQGQDSKIFLLTPQKPVKLKSSEGAATLMRSSKNLQIDKNMLETGKQVLKKEELEKKDSRPELITEIKKETENEKLSDSGIGKVPFKEKSTPKFGINTSEPVANPTLTRIRQRKKALIFLIVGTAVLIACLLIFFIGGKIVKSIKSAFSTSPVEVPVIPVQDKFSTTLKNGAKNASPLQAEYNVVYQKIKKLPANKQEVDENIKDWQDFLDSHQNATDADKCIKDAKTHIKNMQDMRELY
jgi:hypothetical protein